MLPARSTRFGPVAMSCPDEDVPAVICVGCFSTSGCLKADTDLDGDEDGDVADVITCVFTAPYSGTTGIAFVQPREATGNLTLACTTPPDGVELGL